MLLLTIVITRKKKILTRYFEIWEYCLPKIVWFSWIPIFICYRFTIGHPEKTVKVKYYDLFILSVLSLYLPSSAWSAPLVQKCSSPIPGNNTKDILSWNVWMCLAPLLTDTVDVLLQSCLLLLCSDTGQVKPMVPTKLFGFKPVRLIHILQLFSYNVVTDWSTISLVGSLSDGWFTHLEKEADIIFLVTQTD